MRSGPLEGIKVVEFAGIGPSPMCAMLLADLGATVLRLERPESEALGVARPIQFNLLLRGRHAVRTNLKTAQGRAFALDLIAQADLLIEGFRPGAMERLGLGPEDCLARNPKLVYGRMTGWGQDGPLAHCAGHDLNYIALSGALHAIGRAGMPPTPPLNLVGDFGGGALYLAFGLMAGLHCARTTGQGQVVDAAMLDGAASLMTTFFGLQAAGLHSSERGTNVLDSGAPYYDVYACSDGKYVAVASIEPKFRSEFFAQLELPLGHPSGDQPADWPVLRALIAGRIASKPQTHWTQVFASGDACVTPVLSMEEVAQHPHNAARQTFIDIDDVVQPAPAPRFSKTPAGTPTPPRAPDSDVARALAAWGVDSGAIEALRQTGVLSSSPEHRTKE